MVYGVLYQTSAQEIKEASFPIFAALVDGDNNIIEVRKVDVFFSTSNLTQKKPIGFSHRLRRFLFLPSFANQSYQTEDKKGFVSPYIFVPTQDIQKASQRQADVGGDVEIEGGLDIEGNVEVGGNVEVEGSLGIEGGVETGANVETGENVEIGRDVEIGEDVEIEGDITPATRAAIREMQEEGEGESTKMQAQRERERFFSKAGSYKIYVGFRISHKERLANRKERQRRLGQ